MSDDVKQATGPDVHPISPEVASAPQIPLAASEPSKLVSDSGSKLEPFHGEFAEFHEGYTRHYIQLADTKAAWSFAIASGVIVYLIGNQSFRNILASPAWAPEFVLISTTILFLALASACAFLVVAPRLTSLSGEGIVSFSAVALRQTASVYVDDVASQSERELIQARLKHAYDLSKICTRKYDLLRKSFWLAVPGIFGVLATLILG